MDEPSEKIRPVEDRVRIRSKAHSMSFLPSPRREPSMFLKKEGL